MSNSSTADSRGCQDPLAFTVELGQRTPVGLIHQGSQTISSGLRGRGVHRLAHSHLDLAALFQVVALYRESPSQATIRGDAGFRQPVRQPGGLMGCPK